MKYAVVKVKRFFSHLIIKIMDICHSSKKQQYSKEKLQQFKPHVPLPQNFAFFHFAYIIIQPPITGQNEVMLLLFKRELENNIQNQLSNFFFCGIRDWSYLRK